MIQEPTQKNNNNNNKKKWFKTWTGKKMSTTRNQKRKWNRKRRRKTENPFESRRRSQKKQKKNKKKRNKTMAVDDFHWPTPTKLVFAGNKSRHNFFLFPISSVGFSFLFFFFIFSSFFFDDVLFARSARRPFHQRRSLSIDGHDADRSAFVSLNKVHITPPPPPPLSNHPAQVVFRGPAIITWRLSLILVPERKKKVVNTFGGLWLVVDGPPTNQGRWFEAQLRVLLAPLPKRSNWKSDSMETISCVLN